MIRNNPQANISILAYMYFGESFVPKPTQTRGTNYKFNNLLFMWVGPSGVGLHFCYCIDEKNTCSLTGIH